MQYMGFSSYGGQAHGLQWLWHSALVAPRHVGSPWTRYRTHVSCIGRQILFFFPFIFIHWRLITLQYCSGYCHTLTWISHGFTCVPHPDPPTHLPLHPIPLGLPSAPALSTHLMHPNWAGDLSSLIVYLFQCCSLWTPHPHLLPQNPKFCSVHLCLFCYLTYRVIVTNFLNSIYMG